MQTIWSCLQTGYIWGYEMVTFSFGWLQWKLLWTLNDWNQRDPKSLSGKKYNKGFNQGCPKLICPLNPPYKQYAGVNRDICSLTAATLKDASFSANKLSLTCKKPDVTKRCFTHSFQSSQMSVIWDNVLSRPLYIWRNPKHSLNWIITLFFLALP